MKEAILRLSRERRVLAPLAFMIGAFALLFDGLPAAHFQLAAHAGTDPPGRLDLGGDVRPQSPCSS
jgi:hypothetical protein